jgi:uncharacterized protein YeaC (DUF1315 family)
MHTLCF